MQIDQLFHYLDHPGDAADWLKTLKVHDPQRAHANLVALASSGMTLDLLAVICGQLERHLPSVSDPDMALNNFERFVAASRSPLSLGSLLERDPTSLPVLLQILSTSQFLADLLVQDPEGYDLLRITEGQPVARDVLVEEITAEVAVLSDERVVKDVLRRYKRRETLRIAYGDIVRNQPIETVTRQISYLADAVCEAALLAAHRYVGQRRGVPRRPDGEPAQLVVLALGKHGGCELNYSSDIDLMFLYDGDGRTDGEKPVTNAEYFERVVQHTVKLLSESTPLGIAYRVDLRLRPEGSQGPLVIRQRGGPAVLRCHGPHLGTAGFRQGAAGRRRTGTGYRSSSKRSNRGFTAAT